MAIGEISVGDLAKALLDGAPVFDVREPDEYEAGHVPGAHLIPLGTVADHVDEFRVDRTAFVICKSGGRSMRACELLADHGVDVVNVAGGTDAWRAAGQPVVEGGQPS